MKREDCEYFEPKQHQEQTGDCQTDGHYLCAECKHIAPAEQMDEGDNVMRFYPEVWKQNRIDDMNDNDLDDDFQCCDDCDLPDACADFGCVIKEGLKRINHY